MKMGFLGPPVLMGKKDFLIALSLVANVEKNRSSYYFCKVYGLSSWTYKIHTNAIPPGMPKLCPRWEFPWGMLPGRRAHSSLRGWHRFMLSVELLLYWRACRAKAVGQGLSGKAEREGQS
ncbi:hypothetical protein ACFX10_007685 [Malus domestica]